MRRASWGYPHEWLAEWNSQLRITPEYIRTNTVFVAERDGEIIGVIAVEASPDGPEIGHLWVRPHAQGTGVGRMLVERARELASERGWRMYRVVSDPFAQPFYERLGAIPVGSVAAPVAGTPRTLPVLELPVTVGPPPG